MNGLGGWILGNTQWLYTRVVETPVFFLDLWSFPHFLSGLALYAVLSAATVRARRTWLVALLFGYELLELLFIYLAFHAFRPETLKDQGTDVVVGLLGAVVAHLTLKGASRWAADPDALERYATRVCSVLAGLTLAFVWVGNYQYRYNREALNSPGLNWWAFALWASGLVFMLKLFSVSTRRIGSRGKSLFVAAAVYFPTLAAVEYVGYELLLIREIRGAPENALASGLVHGTRTMHGFYLTAPVIAVAVYLFCWVLLAQATKGFASGVYRTVVALDRGLPDTSY